MKNSILRLIITICLIIWAQITYAQAEPKKDSVMFEIPLDSALVQISKLEPQEFMSKNKDALNNNYGFQIEKFEKVFPSMVYSRLQVIKTRNFGKNSWNKTISIKYIDYASLVPVLVAAVQEQQALILKQQQQIEALQKLINFK